MNRCPFMVASSTSLLPARPRRPRVAYARLIERARVDDDAIAEAQRLSRADRQAPIARRVLLEIVQPEDVDPQQTVLAHMPVGGIARIAGMVQHRDPIRLAIDLAREVHPFGALAPGILLG